MTQQPDIRSDGSGPASRGHLPGQALLLTLGRLPILFAILILGIVLARTLSTEEYGIYQAVTWLAAFVPPLLLLGLAKAVYYFVPQVRSPRRFLLRTMLVALALGILTAVAFVLGAGARLPMITVAIILASFGERLLEPVLVSLSHVRRLALLLAAAGVLLLGGVLTPVLLGRPLEEILVGVFLYFFAQAVALLVAVLRAPLEAPGRPLPTAGEHAAYAFPVGIGGSLAQLSNHLDKVVAWVGLPLVGFSVYKRGAMEIPLLGTIAFTILNVATPELVRRHAAGDRQAYVRLFTRVSRLTALITMPLLVFFEITARDFMVLLYGDAYGDAAVVFRIYLLLLLVRVVWSQTLLETTGRAGRSLLCAVVLVLVHAPLSLLFISAARPWVPAAAMLVGHAVAWWGVGLPLAARSLETPIRAIVPWMALLRTAVVSLPGAVALLRMEVGSFHFDLLGGIAIGPRLALSGLLYFGVTTLLFLLFDVLRPADRSWLRETFGLGRSP